MAGILGPAAVPSGSQAFPILASDGERWHAKAPNNPQGARVLVTEYLVSLLGELIGAPVCTVRPVAIPAEFVGFQVVNGPQLPAGIASASKTIADAIEMRPELLHRDRDDNARRHAGVFALFDWCWGDDQQWLTVETDDHRIYSHDHGFYLPPGGAAWTVEALRGNVDTPHPLAQPHDGLDLEELRRLSEALTALGVADLAAVLSSVPAYWSVTDQELDELGRYLHTRAPQVAGRIDEIRAKLGTP